MTTPITPVAPEQARRPGHDKLPTVPQEGPGDRVMAEFQSAANEAVQHDSMVSMLAEKLLNAQLTGRRCPDTEQPRYRMIKECLEMAEQFHAVRVARLERLRDKLRDMHEHALRKAENETDNAGQPEPPDPED